MADKWAQYAEAPPDKWAQYATTDNGSSVPDKPAMPVVPGMEKIGGAAPPPPGVPLPSGLALPKPVSIPLRNKDGVMTPKGLDVPMGTAATVATAPLRFLAGGAEQLGRGTTRVAHPQSGSDFAGGVSDIVRGAGAMALPAAAPAIVAAPLASALGIAGGMAAGAGTEAAAKAVGIPEGYAEVMGDVAGVGGGLLGASGAPALRRVVARAKGDPKALMVQGIKPKSTNIGFSASLDRSMPELKVTEAELGRPIAGVDDLLAATKAAKKRVWKQFTDIAGPQAQRGIDLSPVADAMTATIPDKLRLENPLAATAIEAQANKYRRAFPIEQTEKFLETTNAELNAYYGKYPTAQRSARAGNPDTAALDAQGQSLRNAIYDALDQAGDGAAPREIKQRYGALMNIEEEAYRRQNVAARQQPDSLSEQVGKWSGYGDVARGVLTKNPVDVVSGFTKMKVAKYVKEQQTTDALIRRAFANYNGAPAPIDMPPPFRPAGLLPAPNQPNRTSATPSAESSQHQTGGTMYTPPPADASFVKSTPGMAQPPNPRRALPPGSTIEVPPSPIGQQAGPMVPGRTGVPADDASRVRSISGDFPPNVYDKPAMEIFGKPFAALTPEQKQILLRPPATSAPRSPMSNRPPALGPPGR